MRSAFSRRLCVVLGTAALLVAPVACGDDDESAQPFALRSRPEFVNRVIPGSRPLALVAVDGEGDAAVALSASSDLAGAVLTVTPSTVAPGGVAEVWAELPERADDEATVTVTVTGERSGLTQQLTFSFTAVPGSDDLAATASEIAAVFLDRLAGSVDGIPATTAGLTRGTPVAGLLVVSHYAWFTDTAEIGLAWHIMIAPDDFAELYVRPRGALAPTKAFRIGSWSTALAGGSYTFEEVAAPADVTR